MTTRSRNRALGGAAIIATVALVVSLLPMIASSGRDGVHELDVVVRDMTFYVDGRSDPNPTITLRAGEKVRLRIRNEDAGMRHDFAVKAWSVSTRMLEDRGEQDTIEFRAPDKPGTAQYVCTPHAKMMSGTLRVE